MTTYREQQKGRTNYVLLDEGKVLGTFGNLKKVCEFLQNKDFYSYNTVVRKKEFPIEYKNYSVWKVKHH